MLLITGLVGHLFVNTRTGERMFVYRVRGDVVTGLVFGPNAHKPRRVYLDTLARDWRDEGEESPRLVVAIMGERVEGGPCADPDCPVHGVGADKSKPAEQRLN